MGINQVLWDAASQTLVFEPDELLAERTRYLLVVTNGVRDAGGRPLRPSIGMDSHSRSAMGFVWLSTAYARDAAAGTPRHAEVRAGRAYLRLQLKDEGRAHPGYGANPTQSFKDRGMAMVVAMARRAGLTRLAVPTQGNAGDSLVRYGLAGGMDVVVAMPDDTPMPILGQVAAMTRLHPGRIHLELVKGTIREAAAKLKADYWPNGWFNCATFQEPGWRIEGKKSLGLELAEPAPGETRWALPDAVVFIDTHEQALALVRSPVLAGADRRRAHRGPGWGKRAWGSS